MLSLILYLKMFSSELEEILNSEPLTKPFFKGVYACDTMPKLSQLQSFLIVNTAPSYTDGEHWILLYKIKHKTIYVIDSLSDNTLHYGKCLSDNIKNLYKNFQIISLSRRLQSNGTSYCGIYCIFFAIILCKQNTLTTIQKVFSINTLENDRKIFTWFAKYCQKRIQNITKTGQINRPWLKWKQ